MAMLCGCAAALLAAACGGATRQPEVQLQRAPENLARARHVVIVLIDGLRPDALTREHAPFVESRLAGCAYTLEARTVTPSVTLPSHASMISGLPPSKHRITWNSYQPERGNIRVTTIFDVAHDAGLHNALFGGKLKLLQLIKPDTVNEVSVSDRPGVEVMREAREHLARQRPHLTLIHLPDPDLAGHRYGWMSPQQLEAVRRMDALVGDLFATLEAFPEDESWAVILTSDHGGHGTHHGAATPLDTTIPWVICGNGVEPRQLPALSITATAAATLNALGLPADLPRD